MIKKGSFVFKNSFKKATILMDEQFLFKKTI